MNQLFAQDGDGESVPPITDHEEAAAPRRKRQKTTSASSPGRPVPPQPQFSRKGKACISCRKLKVKCDSAERGMRNCSRCVRLGLQCLSERQIWASAGEVDHVQGQLQHQQHTDLAIVKLERALEDVLEKLGMPALELYAPQAIVEQPAQESPRTTRRSSREPASNSTNGPGNDSNGRNTGQRTEREVSPGPMRSLIEATRLDGLWSQLRSEKQRRKGGMRRMDFDLISEKIITYDQAEEMFQLFMTTLSPYLFSGSIPQDATLERIRTSSTVLFTAIMLVSALHIAGYEQIHEACHSRFLGLVSSALFDRFHTLDDIRGLCIAALWEPALTWKLSGICIRMATELNLHRAFYEAFYMPNTEEQARNESLEKARLWYLLFVLDHQSSIAYGRPPVMAELRPIKDYAALLRSPSCTLQDRALIVQVTASVTLSKAFETFGLEPRRAMSDDDASVMSLTHFSEQARAWREKWQQQVLSGIDEEADQAPQEGGPSPPPQQQAVVWGHEVVDLHYHFSELVLHSVVLRGRSLDKLSELPSRLRPLTLRAIDAAHKMLERFVEEGSALQTGLVGMPLYLHAMIAFAVVFLMKLHHRWHLIGITVDPTQVTLPLVQTVVTLLRACKAGSDHIVFSMANGFERMLKQAMRQKRSRHAPAQSHTASGNAAAPEVDGVVAAGNWHAPNHPQGGVGEQGPYVTGGLGAQPASMVSGYQAVLYDGVNESPLTEHTTQAIQSGTSGISPFETWDFQDQEFWNFGMGYDLLAPGGDSSLGPGFPLAFE